MKTLADAPQQVLVLILQHVPLNQRMSSCALVQRSWAQAAAAATTEVSCTGLQAAAARALSEQLVNSSWAQHITYLNVGDLQGCLQQLSCPKLKQLDLSDCDVCLGPTTSISYRADLEFVSTSGILQGCPDLQELSLDACEVMGSASTALAALPALTALSKLSLKRLRAYESVPPGYSNLLYNRDYDDVDLQPILQLSRLQDLTLGDNIGMDPLWDLFSLRLSPALRPAAYAAQQQAQCLSSLTRLCITSPDEENELDFDLKTTPGLYALPNLRILELHDVDAFEVQHFSRLSSLEALVLRSGRYPESGGRYAYRTQRWTSVADPADLLELLPKLLKLRHLDVYPLGDVEMPVPAQSWAALKLAASLEVLRLQCAYIEQDTWPLLFQGAALTRLRELRLTGSSADDSKDGQCEHPMPAQSLQQLAAACPNLETLELGGFGLLRVAPAAPLSQLQHLTWLRVGCEHEDALAALAQLTGLRHLHVYGPADDLQLLLLTGLTCLTCFERDQHDRLDEDGDYLETIKHIHFAGQVGQPDKPVWQQMVDHCKSQRVCRPVFEYTRSLHEQRDALQDRLRAQQHQLNMQQQRLQAQQQTISQQRRQLAEQQQQLEQQQMLLAEEQLGWLFWSIDSGSS